MHCLVSHCDRVKSRQGYTLYEFLRGSLILPLPKMTSSNLQRWISPFPWNLNMKGDCETYQGSWSASVEYYSMCISLAFGSLNDVFGNIKSSICLRALIWIGKITFAVNPECSRGYCARPQPTDCETDQWIFDQREIACNEGSSADISYFL